MILFKFGKRAVFCLQIIYPSSKKIIFSIYEKNHVNNFTPKRFLSYNIATVHCEIISNSQ